MLRLVLAYAALRLGRQRSDPGSREVHCGSNTFVSIGHVSTQMNSSQRIDRVVSYIFAQGFYLFSL